MLALVKGSGDADKGIGSTGSSSGGDGEPADEQQQATQQQYQQRPRDPPCEVGHACGGIGGHGMMA